MEYLARHEIALQTHETQLVARSRAGDVEAFGRIYAQHERQVFRYAYHLLGNAEDADDAKQETFLRAYQAIRSFKGECNLMGWLLRIRGNLCRDRLKARKRHPETLFDPQATEDYLHSTVEVSDPVAKLEQAQTRETLWRLLDSLPDGHREVLILREIEDLTYEEIAAALGCSPASVKLRLFRARRHLKERMTDYYRARI